MMMECYVKQTDSLIKMGKRSSETEVKFGLLNDCEFITIERG